MTEKNKKIHERLQELLPGYSAAAAVIPKAAKGAVYSAALTGGLLLGTPTEAALIGPEGAPPPCGAGSRQCVEFSLLFF